MHINHVYILQKCKSMARAKTQRILDYGCGSAEIIEAARDLDMEMYGVDAFYEGGNVRDVIIRKGLLGTIVRELEGDRIPFPDGYFDAVVSNQVFEHVIDLKKVMKEIFRVTKRDGIVIAIFPSKEVWREGHCGIPFIHWFQENSKLRYWWIYILRTMGLGYNKEGKDKVQWVKDFLEYLDRFTHYLGYRYIKGVLEDVFDSYSHIEEDYISFRLAAINRNGLAKLVRTWYLKPIVRWLCRKLGGMVLSIRT